MAKQVNMNPDNLIRVLEWLVSAGLAMKRVKDTFSHPLIKYSLLILVASYILFWLGFTSDLIFMMPLR